MTSRPRKVDEEPLVSLREVFAAVETVRRGVKERSPEWYALNRVYHELWKLPTRAARPTKGKR